MASWNGNYRLDVDRCYRHQVKARSWDSTIITGRTTTLVEETGQRKYLISRLVH